MSMIHEPLRYAHDEGHTDVCFTVDGSKFITCGADGDIRIWSCDDQEDPVHICVGEWSLCVRQKGNNLYVATSSNDIQILTLPEGDRNGVLDRFVGPINHIAVGRNSQLIALAGEDMEVKVINLERENKEVTIFAGSSGPCLSVALCPNSKMVAASSGDCKLRIWDIETSALLKEIDCFPKVNSFSNAKNLCRIDFEPTKGKFLAYPEKNTVVIVNTDDWSLFATLSCEVTASYSIVQYSPCGKYVVATSEEGDIVVWGSTSQDLICKSKHEKSLAICGLMWNPKRNKEIVYTDIEGQLGIITCTFGKDTQHQDIENIADNIFEENDDFDKPALIDDDEDNENAISVEKLKRDHMASPDSESRGLDIESLRATTPRPRTPEVPLQPAFMPSSTPEHLDPRYMCWNDVGIIKSYGNEADETASKSIEVDFHDSTFHNSMMMPNYQDYTMGSVSKAALAVANASQINIIPLSATSKEWTLKVEEHEEIVLIAASENLICLAMNNYIIRVCSIFGTQVAIFSVPGPLVSMAAYKNMLLVAYHASGVRKNDQCINCRLVKVEGYAVDSKDIGAALGPESSLMWLGFSDTGTPGMMDSLGMISLYPQTSNTWMPFCDTTRHRTSPSDGFFVTTIFETYQAAGGIKCKGSVYPGFTPRPIMCELPLEPPFAESSTDKTRMEMNLFTWSTLQVADTNKNFKENAIKIFALACKNNLDERALEFLEILSDPHILSFCLKYASRLDKRRLVEKLTDLAQKITNESEDLGVAELQTPEPVAIKPTYKKLSLSSAKYSKFKAHKSSEISTPEASQSKSQKTDVLTPSHSINENSQTPNQTAVNTQDSLFSESTSSNSESIEPKNPFLKSLKKSKVGGEANPLSLTDKFAGVEYAKETKENKEKNSETGEKRKLSDSDEKPKGKQRKLDNFKFMKKN